MLMFINLRCQDPDALARGCRHRYHIYQSKELAIFVYL